MLSRSFHGCSPAGFHRVAYTEWGQASSDPPVICVHGLARNGRDFDRLADRLSQSSHVFCPDIVGRGQSDWLRDPALYGYPQYINDMTALIARTDHKTVDWVGTSMGGIMGMLIAAMPANPIRRLVVNDVGPFIALEELHRIAGYVASPPDFDTPAASEPYLRAIYSSFGIKRDEDWQHMIQYSTRLKPDGRWTLAYDPAIATALSALTQDVDFWAIYDQIKCPVLLLRGTESTLLSAAVAHEMTERGPKARLVEIADTGHAPALMDEAQINLVHGFLRNS